MGGRHLRFLTFLTSPAPGWRSSGPLYPRKLRSSHQGGSAGLRLPSLRPTALDSSPALIPPATCRMWRTVWPFRTPAPERAAPATLRRQEWPRKIGAGTSPRVGPAALGSLWVPPAAAGRVLLFLPYVPIWSLSLFSQRAPCPPETFMLLPRYGGADL